MAKQAYSLAHIFNHQDMENILPRSQAIVEYHITARTSTLVSAAYL